MRWAEGKKKTNWLEGKHSLNIGAVSVKGLWPNPPTPKLGGMSKVKERNLEAESYLVLYLGRTQKGPQPHGFLGAHHNTGQHKTNSCAGVQRVFVFLTSQ